MAMGDGMRIAIDGHLASSLFGGLGTYTLSMVRGLLELHQDDIVVFTPKDNNMKVELATDTSNLLIHEVDVHYPADEGFFDFCVLWEQEILLRELNKYQIDVLFCPVFMAPINWTGPIVVTVHDLAFEKVPEFYREDSRLYYSFWAKCAAKRADALIAVSNYTGNDIRNIWRLSDKPLYIVHNASTISAPKTNKHWSKSIIALLFGVHKPYILYVGGSHKRKNIERLIKAYKKIDPGLRGAYQLVLANVDKKSVASGLLDLELSQDVIVTGYCGDLALPHLYFASEIFVYPSLFEGFGLPIIEAMECGTPVIASSSSAIPEITGDAAILINPLDVYSIANAIELLLNDVTLREDLRNRGKRRAAQFSWHVAAQKTRDILAYVSENQRKDVDQEEDRA